MRLFPGIAVLLFFLFAVQQLSAGNGEVPVKPVYDSSGVVKKQPSVSTQDKYYGDKYWRYEKEEKEAGSQEPGVFDRMLKSFIKNL
ncbi:MAG TPA: hypothetical protein VFU15_17005, partial [Bacteroidia bacterium]|nr:hypothetical protein [Bacteroidia bacterium]